MDIVKAKKIMTLKLRKENERHEKRIKQIDTEYWDKYFRGEIS